MTCVPLSPFFSSRSCQFCSCFFKQLVSERFDEAIDHFMELRRLEPGCNTCGLYEIALAHDLAGRADSAVTWYRVELETPRLRAPDRGSLFELGERRPQRIVDQQASD